jgi:hypothetical protein
MVDGQGDAKPVASFHASTTYLPDAAVDTSDWPYMRAPAGVMSSLVLAALTFAIELLVVGDVLDGLAPEAG